MTDWRASKRKDRKDRADRPPRTTKLFHLRWTPSLAPTRLHFQRPSKLYVDRFDEGMEYPWLRGRRHWVPSAKRHNECSPDQCLVCAHTNPQEFGLEAQADVGMAKLQPNPYCAVSGWIEEWYHLVEKKRQDGQGTYRVRDRCGGRSCDLCADKAPRVYGNRFYYAFSVAQWQNAIEPLMERIERHCRCGGYLFPSHYGCAHCQEKIFDMTNSCPTCGDGVDVDLDPDTHSAECKACGLQWSLLESEDETLEQQANSLVECPKCGVQDYPTPVLVCSNGCDCDPHDIYDAQIRLRKDSNEKQYHLVADGFKIQEPDPKLFDLKAQGDDEFAQKVVDRNKEDLDLDMLFPLLPPHAQAREIHVKNIFSGDREEGAGYQRRQARTESEE